MNIRLKLPQELSEDIHTRSVVELVVIGISPKDKDPEWSQESMDEVMKLLELDRSQV